MTVVAEADICEITQRIWSSVVGLDVAPCTTPQVAHDRTLAGCISITGAWDGAVALHCSAALARRVTACIFDVDPESATPGQTQDAIAELVNMTGGNVKAFLPEPSFLSLPVVAQGRDLVARLPGSRLVGQVAFECLGEPLVVSVHEREMP